MGKKAGDRGRTSDLQLRLFSQAAFRLIGVRAARIVERFFGLICVAIGFQGFTGIQQFFLGG